MYNLDGVQGTKKTKWKNLKPGMIIISGVTINGYVPYELVNYPVLTNDLLNELTKKYQLLSDREVLIIDYDNNFSRNLKFLPEKIKQMEKAVSKLNEFKKTYSDDKKLIVTENIPIIETEHIEKDYLVYDSYNSFTLPYKENNKIPSFLEQSDEEITLNDILNNTVAKKMNIPQDTPVCLHLVVDYSYSMKNSEKIELISKATNYFYHFIDEFLLNTKINLYVFSNECRLVNFPLSGKEIEMKETNYSSFMKKVLHNKKPDIHNKIILFTDGNPSDYVEALSLSEKLKLNKIDYTQIIFRFIDDYQFKVSGVKESVDGYAIKVEEDSERVERTKEEIDDIKKTISEKFTKIVEVCGGNQIILTFDQVARFVAVECYDRYMGLLTIVEGKSVEEAVKEHFEKPMDIKKWEFKKL